MASKPTIRVQCTCRICTTNATRLDRSTPLAAEITADGAARLAGPGGKLGSQAIHGIVHAANHPQLGRALRAHKSAYWAV